MNRKLLEILACPIDKYHPLELFENKSDDEKITEGALYCLQCSRFLSSSSPILISPKSYCISGSLLVLKIFSFVM